MDPDDPRFLNPRDMPAEIQSYCQETGQPRPETEGALIRCALESLALKYSLVLDQLEGLTGNRIAIIHIVGGGSRNHLLNQLTANATGRPVIAGPVEATALGNALVQLRSRGELSSLEEIRAVVVNSEQLSSFEPQPDPQGVWASAGEQFRQRLRGRQPELGLGGRTVPSTAPRPAAGLIFLDTVVDASRWRIRPLKS